MREMKVTLEDAKRWAKKSLLWGMNQELTAEINWLIAEFARQQAEVERQYAQIQAYVKALSELNSQYVDAKAEIGLLQAIIEAHEDREAEVTQPSQILESRMEDEHRAVVNRVAEALFIGMSEAKAYAMAEEFWLARQAHWKEQKG